SALCNQLPNFRFRYCRSVTTAAMQKANDNSEYSRKKKRSVTSEYDAQEQRPASTRKTTAALRWDAFFCPFRREACSRSALARNWRMLERRIFAASWSELPNVNSA